jgi:AAA+ superfamily predicted ATPase
MEAQQHDKVTENQGLVIAEQGKVTGRPAVKNDVIKCRFEAYLNQKLPNNEIPKGIEIV